MSTTTTKKIDKDIVFKTATQLMTDNGKTSSLEVKEELRKNGYWAKQEPVRDLLRELKSEHNWDVNDVGHLEYSLPSKASSAASTSTGPSLIEGDIITLIVETTNIDEDDIEVASVLSDDLGMDNLDVIALQIAIDKKFTVDSSSEDWSSVNTVNDVIKLVEKLIGGAAFTKAPATSLHSVNPKTAGKRKPRMVINDSLNPSLNPRVTINIDYKKVVTGTKDAKDTCDGKDWYVSNKGTDPVIYDQKYNSNNVRTVYARLKGITIQEVRASRIEHL